MNVAEIHAEDARRRLDANNPDRAVYWWQVKRWPGARDDELIADAEVLIAEYDNRGMLHRLDEIKVQPPYIFELISPRSPQGIKHRYVVIEPGWTHVWEHRVVESFSVGGESMTIWSPKTGKPTIIKSPDFQSARIIDCAIFGHQHLKTGMTELMLVTPDGSDHGPFFSLHEARAFVKAS